MAEAAPIYIDPLRTTYHGMAGRLRMGHTLGVYSAVYTRDGKHIASCSHDGSVALWNAETKELVRRAARSPSSPLCTPLPACARVCGRS